MEDHRREKRAVTDGLTCHYCLSPMSVLTRTRDHVVPRATGGLDVRWNIVWSCRDCNSKKANDYPSCNCSFCQRTMRKHWELLRIPNENKKRRKRN